MTPHPLTTLSSKDACAQVRQGHLSVAQLAQAFLTNIQRYNPTLNALVQLHPERVYEQATQIDQRLARGETLPLAGVCFVVKDTIAVAGETVAQGSLLFKDHQPQHDAESVRRLKAAGGLFLGMANASEFACKGVTANLVYGETLNPWDLTTTPGGSSGGSASAIAARLCNLALATDAGGSTRRPASHVGAVGFKPSQGLIANPDAAPEPNFGNSVIGLITHCVSDLQFLLPYLQGENINDVDSEPASRFPTSGFKTNPELKVGVSPQLGLGFPVDHDVADLFQHTVEQLTPLFGQVTYADPIWPTPLSESFLLRLQFAGLAYLYGDTWKKQPELFDPAIGQQIETGLSLSATDLIETLYLREQIRLSLRRYFAQWDVLLTPTTPVVAWPKDELGPRTINGQAVDTRAHAVFTPLFNHAHVPACSLPIGLNHDQLPIGLQLVAGKYKDYLLLNVAATIEQTLRPLPLPKLPL